MQRAGARWGKRQLRRGEARCVYQFWPHCIIIRKCFSYDKENNDCFISFHTPEVLIVLNLVGHVPLFYVRKLLHFLTVRPVCVLVVHCMSAREINEQSGELARWASAIFFPFRYCESKKRWRVGKETEEKCLFSPLNKMDTIVGFRQMIFKIIIQNLQTSNTSASQKNNQRQHQRTFRIFEKIKIRGGGEIFQNKNTWYWRPYWSPRFPQPSSHPTHPLSQH